MKGHILLEGGSEFGGQMAVPDRRGIELAGGVDASLCILPTAAAPDHNDQHAGGIGVRWFKRLGARQVLLLPVVDSTSANDPSLASVLRGARLVYLLGGFTHYLGQTLAGSLCLQAMKDAYASGAVIAGSSAGAMVLCQYYYNPEAHTTVEGLNFIPNACVIPHHNTFGRRWAPGLAQSLPGVTLIGIDEQTGMVDDGPQGAWSVHGKGAVTLYRHESQVVYHPGDLFSW
jgi:cyanophycinase